MTDTTSENMPSLEEIAGNACSVDIDETLNIVGTACKDKGDISSLLPEASEVFETIDTSSASHRSPQDELVIFNLDFEEMAQAMFGQMDLIDQVISGSSAESACISDAIPNEHLLPSDALETAIENSLPDVLQHKSLSNKVKPNKKKEKSEANRKSKEDRNMEQVMRTLSSLKTPEEKLLAICKKYVDLLEEHKTLQQSSKLNERKNLQLIKEKEQLQTEHSKAILTRSRLESLCRELQRQNKVVKDESLMRVREEEEKRKEVSAKFQTTFNEITGMMQDSNQKSTKLREENLDLAQKLKTLIEQYELREQQVDKIIKHKELEVQLSEAKLAKANMMINEEREKLLQDKHKCLQDLADYQQKCHDLTKNEVQLRSQLSLYTDKYEEFQTTLNKSNEIFTHFKMEMDQMSKKIKKLEKETGTWRSRWENSNKALVEMAAEKQHRDVEYINATKKIVQLEKLCRALQTERQTHLAELKNMKSGSGTQTGIDTNLVSEISEELADSTCSCPENKPTTLINNTHDLNNELPSLSANLEAVSLASESTNETVKSVVDNALESSNLETSSAGMKMTIDKIRLDDADTEKFKSELSTKENSEIAVIP